MQIILISTNCPEETTAHAIAESLVDERLVACANLGAAVQSSYRWRDSTEREREWPLVLKTRAALFERVAERLRDLHPYEVPEIVGSIPDRVSEDYAEWIRSETVEP